MAEHTSGDQFTPAYRVLKFVLLGPFLHYLGRPWAEGMEHVPADGGVIMASNHLAVVDSYYLALKLKRPICFLAKQEYFEGKGPFGRLMRWMMLSVNQIPVSRDDRDQAEAALMKAAELVRDGRVWGVYPEGTRSPDGRLHRGRTGMARVAAMTGAPVVPVAMIGTREAQPLGSNRVRRVDVGMRLGAPMYFPRSGPGTPSAEELREFTDRVMAAIRELGGQEYVDSYAKRSEHHRRSIR